MYHVLELGAVTGHVLKDTVAEGDASNTAPGYLMHARSKKTFAFRSETPDPEVVLLAHRSADKDESEGKKDSS